GLIRRARAAATERVAERGALEPRTFRRWHGMYLGRKGATPGVTLHEPERRSANTAKNLGARHRTLRMVLLAGAVPACLLLAAVATAGSPIAYTAYVANFGSGSVTPINAATNTASSPTSINSPSAVAV